MSLIIAEETPNFAQIMKEEEQKVTQQPKKKDPKDKKEPPKPTSNANSTGVFSNNTIDVPAPQFVVKKASKKSEQKEKPTEPTEAKKRVQHDYYTVEVGQEEEDILTFFNLQITVVYTPSPFNIRGIIEDFEEGNSWTSEERRYVVQMLKRKKMNHYVYVHKHILNSTWKEQFEALVQQLKPFIQHCKESNISFNFAITIPPSFNFDNADDLEAVASKFITIIKSGALDLTLLLDQAPQQLTDQQLKTLRSISLAHATLANKIVEKVAQDNSLAVSLL
jgi:hypothetical protein